MARVRGHQSDSLGTMKFHHIGFEVGDIEESARFFQDRLGFNIKESFQFNDELVIFLQKNDIQIELVKPINRLIDHPEFHIAFGVENLDVLISGLKSMKGWERPIAYPNGWESAFLKVGNNMYIEWIELNKKTSR